MFTKELFKSKYIELREKLGRSPKLDEFCHGAKLSEWMLNKIFGSTPYSKLQEECGDPSNKLLLERTPLEKILLQYGELVNRLNKRPTQSDWNHYKCYPLAGSIYRHPHNLKWSEIPNQFLEYAQNKPEWNNVVELIKKENKFSEQGTTSLLPPAPFEKIVNAIKKWNPQRKRLIEETYKVELRDFLQYNRFSIAEEAGESRADLLVNKKYPIEMKKGPSLADYDRLLGQMVRHSEKYGIVIAVICDVANQDQFEDFKRNMNLVFKGINRKAEIIPK